MEENQQAGEKPSTPGACKQRQVRGKTFQIGCGVVVVAASKGRGVRTGRGVRQAQIGGQSFSLNTKGLLIPCFIGEEAQDPMAPQGRVWAGVMVTVALQ